MKSTNSSEEPLRESFPNRFEEKQQNTMYLMKVMRMSLQQLTKLIYSLNCDSAVQIFVTFA